MIVEDFAHFAVGSRARPLAPSTETATVRAVVDWFAATAAGATSPAAVALREALVEDASSGSSQLVGDPRSVDASTAALLNGTAAHAVEFDDIYRDGIYHPGAPTVAAALAAGQRVDGSGADLLRAVAVGYEIGAHIAETVNPAHYRYWHTTATVGAIGAAAAVAEILELDERRFAHALAIATTMAAGLQQSFRSDAMAKPLHAGHAAQAGITAGFAASAGFTGALDILEGEAGFGTAMAESPEWSTAVASLGSPWLIGSTTVKVHSCCGHTFAAIDAMLELRRSGLDPDRIARIDVATYDVAKRVAGIERPATASEARFSIAYVVAAALLRGSVLLRAFEPEALVDPEIRRLVDLTSCTVHPDYEARFPHQRAARVTVTYDDGTEFVSERLTRRGDPDDPVTDEELAGKFTELARPLYGTAKATELSAELWGIAEAKSLRSLAIGG